MNAGESMNRLWSGMLLLGIAYGAFCGKLPEVTDGALRASKEAVVLAISLLGCDGPLERADGDCRESGNDRQPGKKDGTGHALFVSKGTIGSPGHPIGCHKYDL